MIDLTEPGLIQLARHYYPTGFPVETDDYSQDLQPYQRTPEYARWQEAWERAMRWPEWATLLKEIGGRFRPYGECTQAWMTACRRCCVYVERPLLDGDRCVIRVAAAASILAPLYVTYCTTVRVVQRHQQAPHFSFVPPNEAQEHASTLATLVERVLGYQPFPLQFAKTPLPGIRVSHMNGDEATLLDALFDNDLANLP